MTPDLTTRYVRITNNMDVEFQDRFDGVPISVPPGGVETLPPDFAQHILGYTTGATPENMFRHIAKRQGWNTPAHVKQDPQTRKTLAQEFFSQLVIEPVVYTLTEERPVNLTDPIPAEPQPQAASDPMPNPIPNAIRRGPGRPPGKKPEAETESE